MAIPKIDTHQLRGRLQNLMGQLSKLNSKKPVETEVSRTVGLNIGRANVVASEVSWLNNQPVLERCARLQISSDKNLAAQIKNFLAESGFKAKRVNVSLKGQGVVVRFLSFPKMSRADFASSIRYEAEKYLPFSLSEVVFDYQILNDVSAPTSEGGAAMSVVLVAARKTEVERLIQTLQEAGLKPNLIDVDILACANAFVRANPDLKNKCVGIIDLGATDSSLGILDQGNLIFSRDIAFGGSDLTEAIHRKLNISTEAAFDLEAKLNESAPTDKMAVITEAMERLFQEIKSSITYYYNQRQTEISLETIYISGGFSQLGNLIKLMSQQLEIPVKTWNPTNQLTLGAGLDKNLLNELIPYLPVSIGLAMRPRA